MGQNKRHIEFEKDSLVFQYSLLKPTNHEVIKIYKKKKNKDGK